MRISNSDLWPLALTAAAVHRDLQTSLCLFEDMFDGNCTLADFCETVAPIYYELEGNTTCEGDIMEAWSVTIVTKPPGCNGLGNGLVNDTIVSEATSDTVSEEAPYCSSISFRMDFDQMVPFSIFNEFTMTYPHPFSISERFFYTRQPGGETWGNDTYSIINYCPQVIVDGSLCNTACAETCDNQAGVPDCTNVDERLVWDCDYTTYQGPGYYQPLLDYASGTAYPTISPSAAPTMTPIPTRALVEPTKAPEASMDTPVNTPEATPIAESPAQVPDENTQGSDREAPPSSGASMFTLLSMLFQAQAIVIIIMM